jgi:hypothetical protein
VIISFTSTLPHAAVINGQITRLVSLIIREHAFRIRITIILINHVTDLVTYAWNKIYFSLQTLHFWGNQMSFITHKVSKLILQGIRSLTN